MNYDKQAQLNAETQKNEAVFVVRLFEICNDASIVVEKGGFSLVKGNAVLRSLFIRQGPIAMTLLVGKVLRV